MVVTYFKSNHFISKWELKPPHPGRNILCHYVKDDKDLKEQLYEKIDQGKKITIKN